MRANNHAHKPERIVLPRRLVQRRLSGHAREIMYAIANADAGLQEGDIIQFHCAMGWRRTITILGVEPDGHIDAMAYDGRAHYLAVKISDLARLRVIHVDRLDLEDVAMYRRELGLDADLEVAA